ncbi:hypothetical protein COLO4_00244, partial [Corchorus olitorius]
SGCSLTEHRADGFFVTDPAYRLGHHRRDVQLADTAAGLGRGGQRNGVGHHQLVQHGVVDVLDGPSRQHRVGAVGQDLGGAVFLQGLGRVAQGAGGIDHVVDQHAGAVLDVTDDVHHFRL